MDASEIEKWIITYTNEERTRAALRPFIHDKDVSDIARKHSENMATSGKYSHRIDGSGPTDRGFAVGYDCRFYHPDGSYSYGLSENIYQYPRITLWNRLTSLRGITTWTPVIYQENAEQAARSLVSGWMDSSGHRENILDAGSRRIGVGVYIHVSEKNGWLMETIYATQNFSKCR